VKTKNEGRFVAAAAAAIKPIFCQADKARPCPYEMAICVDDYISMP
jgi:hypothetical protein